MPGSFLDHITITAPSLTAGVEYVHRTLGVMPQIGGEHPRMGTHNYFLRLGEKVYLEIIAINPNSPRPQRPRWFQLDELKPDAPPRLATWIVRTDDISAVAASPVPLGVVEPMSRGQLNWLITIPPDGSLPLNGVAPTVIQWPPGVHPTMTLQHKGCLLVQLEAFHAEPEKVRGVLDCIGFQGPFSLSPLPFAFASTWWRTTASRCPHSNTNRAAPAVLTLRPSAGAESPAAVRSFPLEPTSER